ncbi:glycosyltransferase family 39 protein [Geothrix sp. 21YS21S-2]|uniref:ArnT family glycosyltransferase n=1 Tax=Geothrix sp. 21YS21S-2 TaxID=3068893 RepID=UPI0027BA8CD7|nr:glycosyltransferase family 39 protein [Geothrix sp. 21YS21S-2]
MGEFDTPGDACSIHSAPETGNRLLAWLGRNRVPLLFALALLLVLPMRDLWSPDEPDFAQCVREMRERGSWLLPYLNGEPYAEKPILFYWLMKASAIAGEAATGGRGFVFGISAWALRLPSVLASILFLFGFRRWTARFLQADMGDLAALILASTPIWLWQSQLIQIDMVFTALLAWSWLAWIGGYLLIRDQANPRYPFEERVWFLSAYASMSLAFLAKGPLALVLSGALLAAFLVWERDFKALRRTLPGWGLLVMAAVIAPWYVAAGVRGGAGYAYQMIVHQNFERALKAWDHIQPFWRYAQYLAGDFFPWSLLLPALGLFLRGTGARRSPLARFLLLAAVVPFVLLSCSQSKQGKYILMIYPFLALLLAALLQPLSVEAVGPTRLRRLGGILAGALAVPGLALGALAFLHAGGPRIQAEILPYLGPLRVCAAIALLGALSILGRVLAGEGRHVVRDTAVTIILAFLVVGTWGFRLLDARKGYRAWTEAVQPLIQGRRVFFWQTIRSGAMVYTDHRMPELRTARDLEALGPEDRLVSMRREWDMDDWGLDRQRFEVMLRVPVGGGEALLIRRKPGKEAK